MIATTHSHQHWTDEGGHVIFHLADSDLREPQRIDRLLLVVAIAVLAGSLQGYALSQADLRRQVDPYWKRGIPRFQERCHPCRQHTRGHEDMSNASLQRGR